MHKRQKMEEAGDVIGWKIQEICLAAHFEPGLYARDFVRLVPAGERTCHVRQCGPGSDPKQPE